MPFSTANWHWKTKTISPWARSWFEAELPTVIYTTDDGAVTAGVAKVTAVEGDVELGQRKSKLITIFDCKIELEWNATHTDGTEAKGTLTVPEVSHEVTVDKLSDYTFNWSLTTSPATPAHNALYTQVKSGLPKLLIAKFAEFPVAIVDTHGKDLTVQASGAQTPVGGTAGTPGGVNAPDVKTAVEKAAKAAEKDNKKILNTSTVSVSASYMAPADDLFDLLTNEARIPSWTRAPAKSNPTPGAEYSLFAGGVSGKFVSVSRPTEFVQTWRLKSPNWPESHDGTLTTRLEQSSESTTVTFSLAGVPKGQEDEIEKNLNGY
ncbi:hypothetical protein BOTBODRAFT_110127 [Botryobasidium botryosum FD-172 SS1]|uniref:Activator of Hsp90 ATPase AHSA1-like N-terminal domain-containing protein n=1 Tax=Botryobasidium botryosum (strain FD-172 SS1) TaxID=930990 RepID=A0A067MFH2_BOTB1|nr:hypothetical protein BOTBODRAFT_110127 [Botryobasidium botryosum FD-172 SS1]